MDEEQKEDYKQLMMEAARIAVRGGVMTLAFEDFLIDYLDELTDSLDEMEFSFLVSNGKQKTKRIMNDKEYVRYSEWIAIAKHTLTQEINILERRQLESYIETLQETTLEYERVHDLLIHGRSIHL